MSGHPLCIHSPCWDMFFRKGCDVMKLAALPSEATILRDAFPAAFSAAPAALSSFPPESSALVVMDLINGFAVEGALYSPNTASLLPAAANLMQACRSRNIPILFFADSHPSDSPEFSSYPVHCLQGSEESRPVDLLEKEGGYRLFPKNSTNGFLEPAFGQWLAENPAVTRFIIIGCCTDICVQQFALTLKTEFNRQNRPSQIVVPIDLTATYDTPGHPAFITELASYQNMQTSGVELISTLAADPI